MLAVTVLAGWEEFRFGQPDDRIRTLQGRVDDNRTTAEPQHRLARSTASASDSGSGSRWKSDSILA